MNPKILFNWLKEPEGKKILKLALTEKETNKGLSSIAQKIKRLFLWEYLNNKTSEQGTIRRDGKIRKVNMDIKKIKSLAFSVNSIDF